MSLEAKKAGRTLRLAFLSVAGQPAVLKNQIIHITRLGTVHTHTAPPLKFAF